MFISELNHPAFAQYDYSSLRTGIMAGSPCPAQVMQQVIDKMNMKDITICYGMTETSPVSFQTHSSDSPQNKVDTVGRIHPHVEAKIVHPDTKVTLPRGQPGHLLIRGYSVMQGYWASPQATREAIDDQGWMHTGDLAVLDPSGYCKIVGRIKDCIIRGGENIFPREIEEFLYSHPLIQDVSVIGVPDPKFGEEVCAWIKLREGAQATPDLIQLYCKDKIAHYKIPRYILFVDQFPMTITGKIQKFVMREETAKLLKLSTTPFIQL
eukprot:TRINITY_DN2632_c0_g1_i5.p3 TRINITY_DN2632_c0_g1~~TRINITY_DN2632_c0_g1_i5.p3  ORF type:complete len:266 (-),score=53.62 TRINITY_DN2632_c0_g1_i5:1094-1891(-)